LVAASAAAAASLWLHLHTREQGKPSNPASPQAELYIKQPRWTVFDQEGHLSRQLQARGLEQWADEEAARLLEPQLYFRDRQQRQWRVQARTGRAYPDNRPLLMQEGVVMRQEPENSGLVLKTAYLRIHPRGEAVETEAAVVLRSGNWHFTAEGLRANLDQRRLELLAQVRGVHE
jgi:LPS export ABC transporter protein LptC